MFRPSTLSTSWHDTKLSMRTVLFSLLVAGLVWFGLTYVRAQRQQEAVQRIRELGGIVVYQWDGVGAYSATFPWLRELLGDDWLRPVVCVVLSGTSTTDGDLADMTCLSEVRAIGLTGTAVTDRGLDSLARFTRLEYVGLAKTEVGDRGIDRIQALKRLEILDLNETNLTDEGLLHIAVLQNLRELTICGTKVTMDGVLQLQALRPDMQILY